MLRPIFKVLLLSSCMALTACTGSYRVYADMLKLGFSSPQDISFSFATLEASEHDYLYVRVGDNRQVALGLTAIEHEQLKWVSGDRALLVTEQGRVVRTSGLANDLLYVSNMISDPLKRPLGVSANTSWLRLIDWQQGEYGYQVRSQFELKPAETLQFFGVDVQVIPLIEHLHYDNDANFVRFDDRWQNTFWFDAKTGALLKSKQLLAPGKEPLELTFISEVVRQLKNAGINVSSDAV